MKKEKKMTHLTKTEKVVLNLVADGLNNGEIAAKMIISVSTVKKHLESIYLKFAVHNRIQAVCKALKLNLLEL